MKLLLLSSLFGLAFGAEVALLERELVDPNVDDRFHVSDFYVAGTTNSASFAATAKTNKGQNNNGGPIQVKVFKTCPQGNIANTLGVGNTPANNPEILSTNWANWLTIGAETITGPASGVYTHTFDVTVKPQVTTDAGALASGVWDPDRRRRELCLFGGCSPPPSTCPSGGNAQNGKASFCLWYGMHDGTATSLGTFYGFREVAIEVDYKFCGKWESISFKTQAFNPKTGESTRSMRAVATTDCMVPTTCANPSDGIPNNDVTPCIRPGWDACVRVCPPSGETEFMISTVSSLKITETPSPGTTTAPGGDTVIVGTTPGVNYVKQAAGTGSFSKCQEISWLLPVSYFPQHSKESPTTSTFSVTGDSWFAPARRLLSERELQDDEAPVQGQISDEISMTFGPPLEDSSASGIAAGTAAAVAAVGAALLI